MRTARSHKRTLDAAELTQLLPSYQRRVANTISNIRLFLNVNPNGYIAWSGGRDSTAALLLVHAVAPTFPVVWFDSGLEYPETREYITHIADILNLNLDVIPVVPSALDQLAASQAWQHQPEPGQPGEPGMPVTATAFHDSLITTPATTAHTRYGPTEITGLRANESVGRRILLATNHGTYTRNDGTTVHAPIWRWTSQDITAYLTEQHIPENPVYAKLAGLGAPAWAQRVGLVVDGNAAEAGRYVWLRQGWPDLWDNLVAVLPRLNEWR